MTKQSLSVALAAALVVQALATGQVRADWDIGDGDGNRPDVIHENRHRDYEASEEVGSESAAVLALLGKKAFVCSHVGPLRWAHDFIPDAEKLEDLAQYAFSASETGQQRVVTITDLTVGNVLGSIFGGKFPKIKKRVQHCELGASGLACEGSGVTQYVRHYTDVIGIVYLLIENTYAPGSLPVAGLPKSRSNPERELGSLYHCLVRPI